MIFQGQEFLADKWFDDTDPLDWDRAKEMESIITLYRDLMQLRRNYHNNTKGLSGQHIDVYHVNNAAKVMAFHRWHDGGPGDSTIVVLNMTSQPVTNYTLGFPAAGQWALRFDSHAKVYSADYEGQVSSDVTAEPTPYDNQPASAGVSIGPYAGLIFSQNRD